MDSDNLQNTEKHKHNNDAAISPILKTIGVKPAENEKMDKLRFIALLILICYVIYMIYDDYVDDLAKEEALKKLFENDENFYKKLASMEPDVRNKYLDAIKNSLDDNKNKKTNLYNSIRNGLIAGMLSEFISSGSQAKVLGTITRTLIFSSVSAFS